MVLLFTLLTTLPSHALVFTAAKNISERLEAQENRVGTCSDVSIFLLTRRELDGDHDFLGMEGLLKDGRRFARMKEFGLNGDLPSVRRKSPTAYGVYVVRTRLGGHLELRRPILTLHLDDEGRIADLETSRGERLCR